MLSDDGNNLHLIYRSTIAILPSSFSDKFCLFLIS